MKKIAGYIILAALFFGCKKNQTTFDAYFYTSCSSDHPLKLYVNDVCKGELTYYAQGTMDVSDSLRQTFLNIPLPS